MTGSMSSYMMNNFGVGGYSHGGGGGSAGARY